MREIGIVPALHDAPLRDATGQLIGSVEDLLADAATNRPAWLVVRLPGGRRTVAPWRGARPTAEGMRLARDRSAVHTCPATLSGPSLPRDQVVRVCRHYDMPLPAGSWADTFVALRGAAEPVAAAVA